MAPEDLLRQARAACAHRRWADAHAAFDEAGGATELSARDLEDWGLAALLCGHDRESDAVRERAHHAYLDAGDLDAAARVAFWLALTLLMRGEPTRAQGWFGRPRSIVAAEAFEATVWHGYECLNRGMRALTGGEANRSHDLLTEALDVARLHGDPDLELLARNGLGQALLALGRMSEGMAELDEVMVVATTGTAYPQAVGQVYCAAILVCRGCLDIGRSSEWTEALSRWCESQAGLVHYRGQCVVHRSEVLQLQGRWDAATDEVAGILQRLQDDPGRVDVSLGMAHYQRGELHRIRGESREAEAAFRAALAAGHDPQPGLALLRAAQGRTDTALMSLRRALAESRTDFVRIRLLPAVVEVAVAIGDLDSARAAGTELETAAQNLDSPYLRAIHAQCAGVIALSKGDLEAAAGSLRSALRGWTAVGAPYEGARCRVWLARTYRLLGDVESAGLESGAARAVFADLGARRDIALLDAELADGAPAPDGLTPREIEVLRLLATGRSNRAIADDLVLSERTVARHVANIFGKIGVGSRAAATAYAYDAGLV